MGEVAERYLYSKMIDDLRAGRPLSGAEARIYLDIATASSDKDSAFWLVSRRAKADDFTGSVARELLG